MTGGFGDARTAELAENLSRLRARIDAGLEAAGREPGEATLIAVTKTFPADDVVRLARLGVTDIGENRDQEAAAKAAELAAAGVRVRWHFIGQLQRNKCRSVVRYAHLIHAVDSVRLVEALSRALRREDGGAPERILDVLVQVSIDGDPARGGMPVDGVPALADAVAATPGLRLRGVMAVAPLDWDPHAAFARLAEVAQRVRADHPTATIVSAGMSGDLEAALVHGATHLRIGSALLGKRDTLR